MNVLNKTATSLRILMTLLCFFFLETNYKCINLLFKHQGAKFWWGSAVQPYGMGRHSYRLWKENLSLIE
jgi:hypothetical protein